jgi:hypothetical protein
MENTRLADLEENAYRTIVDDGVLDICVGLFVLIMGLILATEIHLVGSIDLPVIFIFFLYPLWRFLRRTFVEPRVGMVRLHPARVAKIKRNKQAVIFIWFLATFGALVLFQWGTNELPGWMQQLRPVAAGFLTAFPIALTAIFFDLKRWWIHVALVVAGIALNHVADVPGGTGWTWLYASGTAITAIGVAVLIRFLREHSIRTPTEEAQ